MLETFILLNTLFVIGVIIYYAIKGIFKGITPRKEIFNYRDYEVKNKTSKNKEYYVIKAQKEININMYFAEIGCVHSKYRNIIVASDPEKLEKELEYAFDKLMKGEKYY